MSQNSTGNAIADVGSGPGYYTFKFAELTGSSGKVYAIDTVQNHLDYVKNLCQKFDFANIETIKDRADGVGLNPRPRTWSLCVRSITSFTPLRPKR